LLVFREITSRQITGTAWKEKKTRKMKLRTEKKGTEKKREI